MNHILEHIDDYVDGALPPPERDAVEAHLQSCASCRQAVDATRRLVVSARQLPEVPLPAADLWPQIAPQLRVRPANRARWPLALVGAGLGAVGLAAALCAGVIGLSLVSGSNEGQIAAAQQALDAGEFPTAEAAFVEILGSDADNPEALQGLSYLAFLRGDWAKADAYLAKAPDDGDTRLRRALIAQKRGDLDAVEKWGMDSGLPLGQLLAAEVDLVDAEGDSAKERLRPLVGESGLLGQTARDYLSMLDAETPAERGHAEATAMWALGEHTEAVETAAELLPALPDDDQRDTWLLVWAGRAVTNQRPALAQEMLDQIARPPEGQAWRVQATRAMVAIAEGRSDEGFATFEALEYAGAPPDGLRDALATAAALAPDPDVARRLTGSQRSVAAAIAREHAGDATWADAIPPESALYRSQGAAPR